MDQNRSFLGRISIARLYGCGSSRSPSTLWPRHLPRTCSPRHGGAFLNFFYFDSFSLSSGKGKIWERLFAPDAESGCKWGRARRARAEDAGDTALRLPSPGFRRVIPQRSDCPHHVLVVWPLEIQEPILARRAPVRQSILFYQFIFWGFLILGCLHFYLGPGSLLKIWVA